MKAFLEGVEDPEPYRVPYSSHGIDIIQDARWEQLPREDQARCASNGSPLYDECDLTYDLETARRQAIRCFRCDAETGMADYSRRTREHIQAMARTGPDDAGRQRELLRARLKPRRNPFPAGRPANLDDIVFLPAALTRLVIDPYREACSTATPLGPSFTLKQPYLFTGFDDAPEAVREALETALAASGCAYLGFRPLTSGKRIPWLQLISPGGHSPGPEADGLIYMAGRRFEAFTAEKQSGRLLGICTAAEALPDVIPYALENGFDLVLLDGTSGIGNAWSELEGAPDFSIMQRAIQMLRDLNREEEVDLVYFGGLRSGTDVAKLLARNCRAGVFGVAMGIAMGGVITNGTLNFPDGVEKEDRSRLAENWIRGTVQETAIIARCTGKTNVHNLEPEDMRAITLTGAEAMGVPLASGRSPRDYF